MGRIHEAMRKAAEERERRRLQQSPPENPPGPPTEPGVRVLGPSGPDEPRAGVSAGAPDGPGKSDDTLAVSAPAPEPRPGLVGETTGRFSRARQRSEREASSGVPGVAVLDAPADYDARLIAAIDPASPRAEEIRTVRSNLLSLKPFPRTTLFTSGEQDEGQAALVGNLATSFAESGHQRVLVVDANLRAPTMSTVLGVEEAAGLADLLEDRLIKPSELVRSTKVAGVSLLSAGIQRDNPGSLLHPGALERVLKPLREEYDVILIDSPALAIFSDATVLAQDVDGVVLVVKLEETGRGSAQSALEMLQAVDAKVLGSIVTNSRR